MYYYYLAKLRAIGEFISNFLFDISFVDPNSTLAIFLLWLHYYMMFFILVIIIFVFFILFKLIGSFNWAIFDRTQITTNFLSNFRILSICNFLIYKVFIGSIASFCRTFLLFFRFVFVVIKYSHLKTSQTTTFWYSYLLDSKQGFFAKQNIDISKVSVLWNLYRTDVRDLNWIDRFKANSKSLYQNVLNDKFLTKYTFYYASIGNLLYKFATLGYLTSKSRFYLNKYSEFLATYVWRSNLIFELVLAFIPFVIALWLIVPSVVVTTFITDPEKDGDVDALSSANAGDSYVDVIGHQWYWEYRHTFSDKLLKGTDKSANVINKVNRFAINSSNLAVLTRRDFCDNKRLVALDKRLVLKAGERSKFLITSTDVIHAFSLPSIGIKLDALPYRLSYQVPHIKSISALIYGFCSELCGRGHGFMPIEVVLLNNININSDHLNLSRNEDLHIITENGDKEIVGKQETEEDFKQVLEQVVNARKKDFPLQTEGLLVVNYLFEYLDPEKDINDSVKGTTDNTEQKSVTNALKAWIKWSPDLTDEKNIELIEKEVQKTIKTLEKADYKHTANAFSWFIRQGHNNDFDRQAFVEKYKLFKEEIFAQRRLILWEKTRDTYIWYGLIVGVGVLLFLGWIAYNSSAWPGLGSGWSSVPPPPPPPPAPPVAKFDPITFINALPDTLIRGETYELANGDTVTVRDTETGKQTIYVHETPEVEVIYSVEIDGIFEIRHRTTHDHVNKTILFEQAIDNSGKWYPVPVELPEDWTLFDRPAEPGEDAMTTYMRNNPEQALIKIHQTIATEHLTKEKRVALEFWSHSLEKMLSPEAKARFSKHLAYIYKDYKGPFAGNMKE
jgi:heme/copper-type cytochrome/quinol oxidase subunit 2